MGPEPPGWLPALRPPARVAAPRPCSPSPAAQPPERLLGAGAPRCPPAQHRAEATHRAVPPRLPPSHLPSARESNDTVQRDDEGPRCLQGLMKHRHLGVEIRRSAFTPTDCPQRQLILPQGPVLMETLRYAAQGYHPHLLQEIKCHAQNIKKGRNKDLHNCN